MFPVKKVEKLLGIAEFADLYDFLRLDSRATPAELRCAAEREHNRVHQSGQRGGRWDAQKDLAGLCKEIFANSRTKAEYDALLEHGGSEEGGSGERAGKSVPVPVPPPRVLYSAAAAVVAVTASSLWWLNSPATGPVGDGTSSHSASAEASSGAAQVEGAGRRDEAALDLGQDEWEEVQARLVDAGLDPGSVDGTAGARTRAAVRAWQSFRGLTPTGYLDAEQAVALGVRRSVDSPGTGVVDESTAPAASASPPPAQANGTADVASEANARAPVGSRAPEASQEERAAETDVAALIAAAKGGDGLALERLRQVGAGDSAHAVIAQANLGYMYMTATGVGRDDTEAMVWLRRAADGGEGVAQTNLGWMLSQGRGVRRDYAEAAVWYRRSAGQGIARAQMNLGGLYEMGNGVQRDYDEAARWYALAAGQGHTEARERLERLRSRRSMARARSPNPTVPVGYEELQRRSQRAYEEAQRRSQRAYEEAQRRSQRASEEAQRRSQGGVPGGGRRQSQRASEARRNRDPAGGPAGACTARRLEPGVVCAGALGSGDRRDGNRYYDVWTFDAMAGQEVDVELSSDHFDTHLFVFLPDGSLLDENDDMRRGWGGTDSRSRETLPVSGTYTVRATSYGVNQTGRYTLVLNPR